MRRPGRTILDAQYALDCEKKKLYVLCCYDHEGALQNQEHDAFLKAFHNMLLCIMGIRVFPDLDEIQNAEHERTTILRTILGSIRGFRMSFLSLIHTLLGLES